MVTAFCRALPVDALAEGKTHALTLGGWPVVVCRSGGALFALIDRCSHAESPLAGGRLRAGTIACPMHGARFEVATGRCAGKPAVVGVRRFETREAAGWLEVAILGQPPSAKDLAGALDGAARVEVGAAAE